MRSNETLIFRAQRNKSLPLDVRRANRHVSDGGQICSFRPPAHTSLWSASVNLFDTDRNCSTI